MISITLDPSILKAMQRAFPKPLSAAQRALDKNLRTAENMLFESLQYLQTLQNKKLGLFLISLEQLANRGGQIGPKKIRVHSWLKAKNLEILQTVVLGNKFTGKVSQVKLSPLQVVRQLIEKEGHQLTSWNGDPRVNPSVRFVSSYDGPEWVLVRAVRYPEKETTEPENTTELKSHFDAMGFPGHFASVAIASVDDPFDPDAKRNGNFVPLHRGCGMHIRYEGLRSF
jgi:hypothetical protein